MQDDQFRAASAFRNQLRTIDDHKMIECVEDWMDDWLRGVADANRDRADIEATQEADYQARNEGGVR